jgi:hypothetical protein
LKSSQKIALPSLTKINANELSHPQQSLTLPKLNLAGGLAEVAALFVPSR